MKRIATTALLSAAIIIGVLSPAQASIRFKDCDPAARPPVVQRHEHHGDGRITIKVWVTHTSSACSYLSGEWVVYRTHVHEWKRYSRDVPGRSCEMWARDKWGAGATDWTHWHLVPWGSATNC